MGTHGSTASLYSTPASIDFWVDALFQNSDSPLSVTFVPMSTPQVHFPTCAMAKGAAPSLQLGGSGQGHATASSYINTYIRMVSGYKGDAPTQCVRRRDQETVVIPSVANLRGDRRRLFLMIVAQVPRYRRRAPSVER